VRRQIDAGVDIINDGEQPRVGFQTYVPQRVKGFGGASNRPSPTDYRKFPDFARAMAARFPRRSKVRDAPQAIGEVQYDDLTAAEQECALFETATDGRSGKYVERFMTAASPGIIATTMLNAFYDSYERYVHALAREMRKEYELIVRRGFVLQLDAPDLAMERVVLFQDKSLPEFLAVVEMHVAALNEALAGIPRDRVRLHCCWGNWEGPHVDDVPMREILPLLYQARVGGLSLEFANPRHQHEYTDLKRIRLPEDMVLLPGVLDSTINYVEHPELVANRICQAVDAVGDRTRVIASTDCGFGTFAGYEYVTPDVVWAKLAAATEGARIASKRLWG
jgi:5-methyltetrahydropteroyltriglutamate--homocysteine methyltransferase